MAFATRGLNKMTILSLCTQFNHRSRPLNKKTAMHFCVMTSYDTQYVIRHTKWRSTQDKFEPRWRLLVWYFYEYTWTLSVFNV